MSPLAWAVTGTRPTSLFLRIPRSDDYLALEAAIHGTSIAPDHLQPLGSHDNLGHPPESVLALRSD
jgi:hypothetical protein